LGKCHGDRKEASSGVCAEAFNGRPPKKVRGSGNKKSAVEGKALSFSGETRKNQTYGKGGCRKESPWGEAEKRQNSTILESIKKGEKVRDHGVLKGYSHSARASSRTFRKNRSRGLGFGGYSRLCEDKTEGRFIPSPGTGNRGGNPSDKKNVVFWKGEENLKEGKN